MRKPKTSAELQLVGRHNLACVLAALLLLRASGLARWALGGLAWVGAGALGGHEALVWWQDGALLAALIAPAP